MRIRILCAALLAAAHAATSSAQPAAPAGDGWVALSIADYLKLREQAHPRPPTPPGPPARATTSDTSYELAATDGLATGTAELTIDVFDDGWVEVPLPPALFVRAARLGGRPIAIIDGRSAAEGGAPGGRRILLSQKGRSIVTLDVAVPIAETAGQASLQLPAASGGLVRAALTVPRADVAVAVGNGTIVERATAAGVHRVSAHAAPGQTLVLTWRRQRPMLTTTQPVKLRGTVQHVVGLGEETAIVTARVTIDVLQGTATGFALRVPAGLTVNQVQGAHVADWDVQGETLSVTLLDRVDRQVAVVVSGEFRPPASGRLEVPLMRLVEAEREAGAVAVEVLGAGEVTHHDPRGLDPTDASELGDLLTGRLSPAIVAFRYRGDQPGAARGLTLDLTRYTPQEVLLAAVDAARYRALVTEDGKALVEGRLAVRNNQRGFLAVTLPAGSTLWSVTVDGRPVRPGTGAQGSVLVPLPKRRSGTDAARVLVGVMYAATLPAWGPAGDLRLTLPALDLPVQQMGLTVTHSPRYQLKPEPSDFHAQPGEPPLSGLLQLETERDNAAFRSDAKLADGRDERRAPPPAAPVAEPPALVQGQEAGRVSQVEESATLGLVARFRREARGVRSVGTLPVLVPFPSSGRGVYLTAALTAEGAAPTAAFTFKRTVK